MDCLTSSSGVDIISLIVCVLGSFSTVILFYVNLLTMFGTVIGGDTHTLCQCIIHPQFISGSLCEGSLTILLRFLPTHSRRCTTCKLALHLNIRPHASSILCHLHLLNLLASSTCIFYLHLLSISSASPQHLPLESPVSLFGLPLSPIQPSALSLPISAMDFIFITLSVSRRVSCSVSVPAFTFAV